MLGCLFGSCGGRGGGVELGILWLMWGLDTGLGRGGGRKKGGFVGDGLCG